MFEATHEPVVVKICDWCQEEIHGAMQYEHGLPYHQDCLDRKLDVQTKNAEPDMYDEDGDC